MGAGKTTVGRGVRGSGSSREFVDTDELVESHDGHVASPRSSRPRASRRSVRSNATRSPTRAASPEPLVIACGGGVVLDPENRRTLRDAGVRGLAPRRRRGARRPGAASRRTSARCSRPTARRAAADTLERHRGRPCRALRRGRGRCGVDTDGPVRRRGRRPRARGVRPMTGATMTRVTRRGHAAVRRARRPGRAAEAGAVLAGIRRVAVVSQAPIADAVRRRDARRASTPSPRSSSWATARTRRRSRPSRTCAGGSRPGVCCAATRWSRSAAAWSATPPASRPRPTTVASRCCRCRRRCSRWSTRRSAARPR